MNQTNPQAAPMPELLTVSPSPHARRGVTTTRLMIDVLIALAPTTLWGVAAFGPRAALVLLLSVASAVLFELLAQKLLRRPVTVRDCSAAVTGLLLGLNLSPDVPLYIPVVGAAFAIVVVKQLFGGIGKNVMNPALAARVFLMLAWTNGMTQFSEPFAYLSSGSVDAVASATPLASLKGGVMPAESLADLFLGKTAGCIGEVSTLLLLVGGIYLLARRVIGWQIPVSFLGTVALLTFVFPQGGADRLSFMAASLCSGGLVLGAVFMATDYVTSPVTGVGRLIYGCGCGLLVVFIRYFGGYPEGVSFAILIMNALVWYLDMLTKPRVYGKSRGKRREQNGGGTRKNRRGDDRKEGGQGA